MPINKFLRQISGPIAFAVSLFMLPLPAAAEKSGRFALVIGVTQPQNDQLPVLQHADDDAARMYNLFKSYSEKTALLSQLDDRTAELFPKAAQKAKEPTLEQVQSRLKYLFMKVKAAKESGLETEFFLVYSGYQSGSGLTLQDGVWSRTDLINQFIKQSPADTNHIIVSSCKEGEEVNGLLTKKDLAKYTNTGVIYSSSIDPMVHEWDDLAASVFSHEVFSAFVGAADLDANQRLTYAEVQGFVKAANKKVSDSKLEAVIFAPAQQPNRPLILTGEFASACMLQLPQKLEGRLYFQDDQGIRYADLNKSSEQSLTIALLPAKLYNLRDMGRGLEFPVRPKPGELSLVHVGSQPFDVSTAPAIQPGLFATAYTASLVPAVAAAVAPAPKKDRAKPKKVKKAAKEDPDKAKKKVARGRNKAKQNREQQEQPSLLGNWRLGAGIAAVLIGVAAIAEGGAFTYLSNDSSNRLNTGSLQDVKGVTYRDKVNNYTVTSLAFYGVGAAFVGLSAFFFATAFSAEE